MRLGIGSYTYGWAAGTFPSDAPSGFSFLSAADLIDRAVRLDVPVVQLCVLPDLAAMDEVELGAVRGRAEANGIALEIGTMGSEVDRLERYLHIARLLNAGLVRTIFTNPSPHLAGERRSVEQVEAQYAAAGVTLAIENYEMTGVRDLAAFVRHMDSEHVGICLDTVNSLGRGEGVSEVTDVLMPYTKCLHIKDFAVVRNSSNNGFAVVGAPAGEGILDLADQMRLLHAVAPDASIVLEQWTPIQDSFTDTVRMEERWAEEGIANMKAALAQVESP